MKKPTNHQPPKIKPTRRVFNAGSGAVIAISKNLKNVIKLFPINSITKRGNSVLPVQRGPRPGKPITHHQAIKYYSELMHDAYWKEHNRIYGPPKVTYFRVRPAKLIRSGKNYHVVERINGPNLDDFISYLNGEKFRKRQNQTPEQKSDFLLRRDGLANLLKTHKPEVIEFKKHIKELHNEIINQIDWIRHQDYVDLYESNLKESDFIVEGIERNKQGQLRLKLVMVDYQ